MEKYIQKKLVISDEIHISGLLEKNKINSKFNIENLYNTQNNNFFVSQNIKEELIEKKSSSLKLILSKFIRESSSGLNPRQSGCSESPQVNPI